MVKLTIKYDDKIIAEKNISEQEYTNIIDVYKSYFGLDISQYSLHEFDAFPSLGSFKEFNLKIRLEDLIELRNNKFKKLLE
jgi:hypothetical protein